MSLFLDSLSLRCLWDFWGENISKKIGLDRVVELGLEFWFFGFFNGVYGYFLICYVFFEYRFVVFGYCCFFVVFVY